MKYLWRSCLLISGLILFWQGLIALFHLPPYILPSLLSVLKIMHQDARILFHETFITVLETLSGLFLGIIFGSLIAIGMAVSPRIRFWFQPVLLISQSLPTFALAPLIVIWVGYGMGAKIITTVLMLFFPIVSAFYDGLRQTDRGWLDIAKTYNASTYRTFIVIKIPAALPSLASGIRVATAIAPIGAVIGEWVGASHGLGYLMLDANARMQISLMFAALIILVIFSMLLYATVNILLKRLIFWQKES